MRLFRALRLWFVSLEKQAARMLVLDEDERSANLALASLDEDFAVEMGWVKPAPVTAQESERLLAMMNMGAQMHAQRSPLAAFGGMDYGQQQAQQRVPHPFMLDMDRQQARGQQIASALGGALGGPMGGVLGGLLGGYTRQQ